MIAIKWWKPVNHDESQVQSLREQLGLSAPVARVLAARGIVEPQQARDYLQPQLSQISPPSRLKDAPAAAGRIRKAIEAGERIRIWGDYDCDGITATALLHSVIEAAGGRVDYHIPRRTPDGYGLNEGGICQAACDGIGVIVSVDCGIRAHQHIRLAADRGIDVVILDHHRPGDELPPAAAVVDPKRNDCSYPFGQLAAVGVAFQVCRLLNDEHAKKHLDLVALGTVADVVPLVEENRVLVREGIKQLRRGERPGLRWLARKAGISTDEINAGRISYQLAPRLNAPGRLNAAEEAVDLLLTDSEESARRIAEKFDELNRQRREIQREVEDAAQEQLVRNPKLLAAGCLLLADPEWHSGVLGPSASQMVQMYRRPVILLTRDPEDERMFKGSGRSVEGFSLVHALSRCEDLLGAYGGHRMAAGLSVSGDNLQKLSGRLDELVRETLVPGDLLPKPRPAHQVQLPTVSLDIARELEQLRPFGVGNPRPLFCSHGIDKARVEAVGDEAQHLVLHMGGNLRGIGFNLMRTYQRFGCPESLDIAYFLERDRWNNRERLQLRLWGLRPAGSGRKGLVMSALRGRWRTLSRQYPSEDVLRKLYRVLNRRLQPDRDSGAPAVREAAATEETTERDVPERGWFDPRGSLADRILHKLDGLDRLGLHTAMLIFSEVDLMAPLEHKGTRVWLPLPVGEGAEVSLKDSPTYRRGQKLREAVRRAASKEDLSDAELAAVLYDYPPRQQD